MPQMPDQPQAQPGPLAAGQAALSAADTDAIRLAERGEPTVRPNMAGDGRAGPALSDTARQRLDLAICDANPILADQLSRVLVADDGLSKRFNIRILPFGLALLPDTFPDILIFDPAQGTSFEVSQSEFVGIDPIRTALIGYCANVVPADARALMARGFRAIIPQTVDSVELVRVVSAVSFNGTYLHETYKETVCLSPALIPKILPASLTDREIQVLRQVALGSSLKEIAAGLKLSTKTVDTYKTRANRKLDLRSRSDIVRFAIQSGWLQETPRSLAIIGRA